MKKILMVCSCLALLLALSVPTFAADVNDPYALIGEWTFNDTISYPSSMDFAIDGSYYAYSPNSAYTISRLYTNNYGDLCTDSRLIHGSNGWTSLAPHVLNITGGASLSNESFASWLKANAIKTLTDCDGSSCPASDVNHDDICDDCGLPFTYNLRDDTTYLYNDIRLPIVPSPFGDKATYYTLYDDGTGTYTLVAANVRFWEDSGSIVLTQKGNLIYYASAPGDDEWSQYSTQTSGNWVHNVKSSEIVVWSSHIIHDFTTGAMFMQGDANFLPPLMEMAGLALSGEMVKIGKILMILLACGVGLMACLVVLNLFGKVLKPSLKQ